MSAGSVAVYIDPFSRRFERDALFDPRTGSGAGDDLPATWVHLRERLQRSGIDVHTADLLPVQPIAGRSIVYISLGILGRFERIAARPDVIPSAFFAFECPIVEPRLYRALPRVARSFRRVYSFTTAAALEPFVGRRLSVRPFHLPHPYDRVHEGLWKRTDRKFLAIINANKLPRLYDRELYTERLRAVEYFERFDEIDLYGVGWDAAPMRLGYTRVPATIRWLQHAARTRLERRCPPRDPLRAAARRANRGPVASKAQTLAGYQFAICFENMILEGWITEKIFDCFLAGAVPVYLGAPDIERFVPRECYVDMREFGDYAELRAFLHELSPAEVQGYRDAARAYLESDRFRPFTKEAFADLFCGIVAEDTGVAA